ncbi:MAG: S8 family serine peptidase [Bacteroidota bacterium]
MKKKWIILSIIVLLIILGLNNNNTTKFYYAYNKRIELIPLKHKIIVKYKEIKDSSYLASFINTNVFPDEFLINPIDYQSYYITLKPEARIVDFINIFRESDEILSINPVYVTRSGNQKGVIDEILVLFHKNISEKQKYELHSKFGVGVKKSLKSLDFLIVPPKEDAIEIANQYQESGMVEFAHPNFISEIEFFQDIPNDEYFNWQFPLHNTGDTTFDGRTCTADADVDAPEAWEVTKGNQNIVIAVIDHGLTSNHPDLPNARQLRLNGSNFGEGDPDDPSPTGDFAHGNACAGTIAATQDNNKGVTGIAPNCKIMPIRVDATTTDGEKAEAIEFAYENGADIISCSWGDEGETDPDHIPAIVTAIENATTEGRDGLGSIVVFAASNTAWHAGNDPGHITFPACVDIPGVITVGASDRNDDQADYSPTSDPESNDNQLVDVVAPSHRAYPREVSYCRGIQGETWEIWTIDIPGTDGYNPWPRNAGCLNPPPYQEECPASGTHPLYYTGRFGGTSHSCPLTAGIAALILSLNSNYLQLQVYNIIACTADEVGGITYTNGWSEEFGFGRVNAYQAVSLAQELTNMYITGESLVCSSVSKTFILHNRPSQTTVNWEHSNNLVEVSGQGTNNYCVKATAYASSPGWVEATIKGDNGGELIFTQILQLKRLQ